MKATAKNLRTLGQQGFDVTEARHGKYIEVVATGKQARGLKRDGVSATIKRDRQGPRASRSSSRRQQGGTAPTRTTARTGTTRTSGEDGEGNPRQTLYQELQALAASRPDLVKPLVIGHTVNGVPILALQGHQGRAHDPRRPAPRGPLQLQPARSRVDHLRDEPPPRAPVRRQLHEPDRHDAGGLDQRRRREADDLTKGDLTKIVNANELWFVVVANPDGYDFTFTEGNRLWRKNLRDNNKDGQITQLDGVDPNRNYPTKWGYDNEGSSDDPASETYRGTGAEVRARDAGAGRPDEARRLRVPDQLPLCRRAAAVPDRLAADDVHGRRPDLPRARRARTTTRPSRARPARRTSTTRTSRAELYMTNGETTDHAHARYGTLAWTPEMDVSDPDAAAAAAAVHVPGLRRGPTGGVREEHPVRARRGPLGQGPGRTRSRTSATRRPTSSSTVRRLLRRPADRAGRRQARARQGHDALEDQRRARAHRAHEGVDGGERYGAESDIYYHRLRGKVTGTKPGDEVRVWFTGGGKRSQSFTYTLVSDTEQPVLVMAAEDYPGADARVRGRPRRPNYLKYYTDALEGATASATTSMTSTPGAAARRTRSAC